MIHFCPLSLQSVGAAIILGGHTVAYAVCSEHTGLGRSLRVVARYYALPTVGSPRLLDSTYCPP
jgi:hypothetical protein